MAVKPLGCRAYGSIGHLPSSRLGPSDSSVPQGQADICCKRARRGDTVYVEDKLDGSCCSVARIDDKLLALTRAGYLASTSPYEQHWLFGAWVQDNANRFGFLRNGERVVGEWIAQAHGTVYAGVRDPFYVFDLFTVSGWRLPRERFWERVEGLQVPQLIHSGGPFSVETVRRFLALPEIDPRALCEREGAVWRVEREGRVDFLAKWVNPQKIDGRYLPEVSGHRAIWNWGPKAS